MLFVPELETFIKYLETRSNFKKTAADRLRQNIFESDANQIVYSIEFINCIESMIGDSHELKDECNLLIKSMIDNVHNESLKVELTSSPTDSNIVFEQLLKYSCTDKIVLGVSETKENIDDNFKILNLSNLSTSSKNHIFSKLLTGEVCQIRHTDLTTNSDLVDLLNHVYDLYDEFSDVIIIDRQANLNHTLYDHLILKTPTFKYYKLRANGQDGIAIRNKLIKYELYNTNNTEIIHERCLIIKDIIITMDEDPFNIIHRDTWTITIDYSPDFVSEIITNKCGSFIKTLF